ncbi:MAG: cysteine-rich CWC family protein [Polaromonas sp.]|uniref:cysteine-rich CWC family protein n=1 Tax=Polaromonas sp. TaxID=1869339 RepID=UPI00180CCCEE|nr:cysteine-rich CWC family protein [Polaromonas sp.]NMM11755.1 cysteine-rich CWC family protein [Polaromonas sp.]
MPLPAADLTNTLCPRCGAALRCGMVAGDAECWCVQLPNVMPVPFIQPLGAQPDQSAASCFCPACLKRITDDPLPASSPNPSPAPG